MFISQWRQIWFLRYDHLISSTHVEDKWQLLSQIVNSFIQRQVSMKFLFHIVLVLIRISVKRNVAEEKRLLNDPEALIT